jgi:hypothetical protein
MSNNLHENLTGSAKAFREKVWPILSEHLPGRLVQIEELKFDKSHPSYNFADTLDGTSGIDAWQIVDYKGIRGIASRIQVIDTTRWSPFTTFTVRIGRNPDHTYEYDKKKFAIENDWLYPYWTVQGYVADTWDGELLNFALAKTVDVISRCNENQRRRNGDDDTWFYYVYWDDYCEYIYDYRDFDTSQTELPF